MASELTPPTSSGVLSSKDECFTTSLPAFNQDTQPTQGPLPPPELPRYLSQSPTIPATSVPGDMSRQDVESTRIPLEVNISNYAEQARLLLENQRLNFEREREMFEKERKLWDAERKMLKSKIADLQGGNDRPRPARRRFSHETQTVRFGQLPSWRESYKMADAQPLQGSLTETNPARRVWDTPQVPVTRVFAQQERPPSERREAAPSVDALVNQDHTASDRPASSTSIPVPVTMLDSSLDGITLKSGGLESSFLRVSSPKSASPARCLSPKPRIRVDGRTLYVNINGLSTKSEENLVRNAGHTPMESSQPVPDTPSADPSRSSSIVATGTARDAGKSAGELSVADPPKRPSEEARSYFSSVIPLTDADDRAISPKDLDGASDGANMMPATRVTDGDRELKGPLAMKSKPDASSQPDVFLDQLNAKLHEEAERRSPDSEMGRESSNRGHEWPVKTKLKSDSDNDVDDEGPTLKLKKSMNFGSEFGSSKVGLV